MSLPPEEFVATARTVNQTYANLEDQADRLLERYAEDYTIAGLADRWDDVPGPNAIMYWRPEDVDGLYFSGTDRDGDALACTVPFDYILDPTGFIERAKAERQARNAQRAKDQAIADAANRQQEIHLLEARLAQLREKQA